VGQLTRDLLVPSLQIPHVGYLDDPYVLPCAGNDAYTKRGSGVLCSNLEIYYSESKKLVLLQQRAPVASVRASFSFKTRAAIRSHFI
jgi:proteasome assembly chaperone 2